MHICIPIPGIAIAIRLAITALIPWYAAFFDETSKLLYLSSTKLIPLFSSLKIAETILIHIRYKLSYFYLTEFASSVCLCNWLLRQRQLEPNGQSMDSFSGIYDLNIIVCFFYYILYYHTFVSRFSPRAVVKAPPVAITYDVKSWLQFKKQKMNMPPFRDKSKH